MDEINYMERGMTVDISAINIYFILFQEGDHVVDIGMSYGMKQKVVTYFFDLANHFYYYF